VDDPIPAADLYVLYISAYASIVRVPCSQRSKKKKKKKKSRKKKKKKKIEEEKTAHPLAFS
jgi:hypothetical protein